VAKDPGTDLERLEPYLADFREAALLEGEDVALIAAMCLRETLAGWARGYEPKGSPHGRGDNGHGYFLFQFDDRGPYARLPRECPEATPMLQARWACAALQDARRELVAALGPAFERNPLFEVATVCCFNAGSPAVVRAIRAGRHPDHATTDGADADREGDYGSDVLRRRDAIRALLAGAEPVPPAAVPPPEFMPSHFTSGPVVVAHPGSGSHEGAAAAQRHEPTAADGAGAPNRDLSLAPQETPA
jgi:hypothetical protein